MTRRQIVTVLERNPGAKAEVARRAVSQRAAGAAPIARASVTRWCQGVFESANIAATALEVALELKGKGRK